MDPIAQFFIPGLVGGVVVACLLVTLHRARPRGSFQASQPVYQLSTDVINIAHIRVVGVGGLGLVAMCALVAVYIPTVGLSLAAGFVLGTLHAAVLILRRKKSGPMPSSGLRPGANTVLSIDAPARMCKERGRYRGVRHFGFGGARG